MRYTLCRSMPLNSLTETCAVGEEFAEGTNHPTDVSAVGEEFAEGTNHPTDVSVPKITGHHFQRGVVTRAHVCV